MPSLCQQHSGIEEWLGVGVPTQAPRLPNKVGGSFPWSGGENIFSARVFFCSGSRHGSISTFRFLSRLPLCLAVAAYILP
jgi:hypothetical protein